MTRYLCKHDRVQRCNPVDAAGRLISDYMLTDNHEAANGGLLNNPWSREWSYAVGRTRLSYASQQGRASKLLGLLYGFLGITPCLWSVIRQRGCESFSDEIQTTLVYGSRSGCFCVWTSTLKFSSFSADLKKKIHLFGYRRLHWSIRKLIYRLRNIYFL